jgi:hypothetical protein
VVLISSDTRHAKVAGSTPVLTSDVFFCSVGVILHRCGDWRKEFLLRYMSCLFETRAGLGFDASSCGTWPRNDARTVIGVLSIALRAYVQATERHGDFQIQDISEKRGE